MTIAGVDGTKGGWLTARLAESKVELKFHSTFNEILADTSLDLILVDVPIGLPNAESRGADVEARQVLQKRRSSVFPAPLRSMLAATTWEEACQIRFRIEGKRCSKQTFAIMDKIAEVDAVITPALQARVIEAHPEVSFTFANAMEPMRERKGREDGRRQRIELLDAVFPGAESTIHAQPRSVWLDCADALACLMTAVRVRDRRAIRLPRGSVETDGRGLRMEIVA